MRPLNRVCLGLIIVFIFAIWLSGCSSHQIPIKPKSNLQKVNAKININVHAKTPQKINSSIIDDLEKYLKAELIVNDFKVVKAKKDCINLDVAVQDFTPGNQALRFFIGFGAGRASLIYTVEYNDQNGNVLASMKSYERFTGGEISFRQQYGNPLLREAEGVQNVLVQEAAKHIVQLGLNQTSDLTEDEKNTKPSPSRQ